MIKLIPVDISKINGDEHQDLKADTYYLAKINSKWYAGTFIKQWYGWNFDAVYSAGYQLSYGGWEHLYEIIDNEVIFDSTFWGGIFSNSGAKCLPS